ncbi:MAG: helix-turn-helix transcriptional regulator [Chitinophagaceae bacterium]|nr:helix-turn-helix transcriptional regulator [Chitinophagaceae bacterium]
MNQNNSNIISFNENTGSGGPSAINYLDVKKAAAILRAINHKLRQSIIKLLEEKPAMTVTEIYVKLRVEQSVASQHLAILRRAEFVKTSRDGKNIHYALNMKRLAEVNTFVKQLLSDE